jgi:hypothetical protein
MTVTQEMLNDSYRLAVTLEYRQDVARRFPGRERHTTQRYRHAAALARKRYNRRLDRYYGKV